MYEPTIKGKQDALGVDLVGGYYDAGDNMKYGLPMAFTITTLSWAAIFYGTELKAAGEMHNVHAAIRWGIDFFLKASHYRNQLYVQVGDPVKDPECWVRPENMKTPRTVLKINQIQPGSEIAAETSAAMAAASIVFRHSDHVYSRRLLNKAKWLFKFANTYKGTNDGECPFYCSFSGYNLYFEGRDDLSSFKQETDSYICSILPESPHHQVYISPGGMIHLRDGANTQYVSGTAFLFIVYSDLLATHKQEGVCGDQKFGSDHLMSFAKQQMDYVLGKNPKGRSYMVGFGNDPPKQINRGTNSAEHERFFS